MKTRSYYLYQKHGKFDEHIYAVIADVGGMHLQITDYGADRHRSGKFPSRYATGLEFHYRAAPSELYGAPSHDQCWLTKCPCWHDSSKDAGENFLPQFQPDSPHLLLSAVEVMAIKMFDTTPGD